VPGKYQIAYDVDITRDLEPPDDNLYVRVNVLKDVGQFVGPESGSNVDLKKGDEIFLRRGDIEHLVRQGDVEHRLSMEPRNLLTTPWRGSAARVGLDGDCIRREISASSNIGLEFFMR
tara:strand:- start:3 stop:356 length:354 start_codon:yes stop_codon:yes gene_type:complete